MRNAGIFMTAVFIFALNGCMDTGKKNPATMKKEKITFSYDKNFLEKHTGIIELRKDESALIIVPEWQGRVMTSTCEGDNGFSFGWINYELISSGNTLAHMNPYGGEERLWLGPEGGQFALFFRKGDPFEYDYWQTPALLDTEEFHIDSLSDIEVIFSKKGELTNYSGHNFNFLIERKVEILEEKDIASILGANLENVKTVAYRSENTLKNTGNNEWTEENGLLSIWMLGMFNPSPSAVVIIPVKEGNNKDLGPPVNDNYFGSIPEERLFVKDNIVYFKADGLSRGKIGIPPLRSKGIMASYDPDNSALTFLVCDIPDVETRFVNSAWELQDEPYSGDALNSYNDGPLEDGSIMGPFYELETSSPALPLARGENYSHSQTTIHITGSEEDLNKISINILGVNLKDL